MSVLSAGEKGRSKIAVVELIAHIVLAFGIGLATAITLAGVVLLLAHDAQAANVAMPAAQAQTFMAHPTHAAPRPASRTSTAPPTQPAASSNQADSRTPRAVQDSRWNLLAGLLTLVLAVGLYVTARRRPLARGR